MYEEAQLEYIGEGYVKEIYPNGKEVTRKETHFERQDRIAKVSQKCAVGIRTVKDRLGKKCSYLSYTRKNDDYGVKAIIHGKEVTVALGGTPADVDFGGYDDLYKQLEEHAKDIDRG